MDGIFGLYPESVFGLWATLKLDPSMAILTPLPHSVSGRFNSARAGGRGGGGCDLPLEAQCSQSFTCKHTLVINSRNFKSLQHLFFC